MLVEEFPDEDHGHGVEFAVAEQGFAGGCGLVWIHVLNLGEDGHGVASVLHPAVEVINIKNLVPKIFNPRGANYCSLWTYILFPP